MQHSEGTNPVAVIRERLDGGRKWRKGTIGDYKDTDAGVCLIGASVCVDNTDRWVALEALRQVIVDQYRDRLSSDSLLATTSCVIQFNDHPLTEWSDVDAVTEKAALLVAERVES